MVSEQFQQRAELLLRSAVDGSSAQFGPQSPPVVFNEVAQPIPSARSAEVSGFVSAMSADDVDNQAVSATVCGPQ